MDGEEDGEQVGIADGVFIKIDFYRFGVAGLACAHLGISGVLGMACDVAAFHGFYAIER